MGVRERQRDRDREQKRQRDRQTETDTSSLMHQYTSANFLSVEAYLVMQLFLTELDNGR